jgi:hypothetical protein
MTFEALVLVVGPYAYNAYGGYRIGLGSLLGGMQISLVTACSAIMAAMLRHFDI